MRHALVARVDREAQGPYVLQKMSADPAEASLMLSGMNEHKNSKQTRQELFDTSSQPAPSVSSRAAACLPNSPKNAPYHEHFHMLVSSQSAHHHCGMAQKLPKMLGLKQICGKLWSVTVLHQARSTRSAVSL